MKKQIVLLSFFATVSLIGMNEKNVVEKLKENASPTVQLTQFFASPVLTSGADIANDAPRNQIITTGDPQLSPADFGLQIYDYEGNNKGTLIGHNLFATCLTKLPNDPDHVVSSGADGLIFVWNLKNNQADNYVVGNSPNLCLLALNDNVVVAGGGTENYSNALYIWDLSKQDSVPCVGHKQIPCVKLISSQLKNQWFASNASNYIIQQKTESEKEKKIQGQTIVWDYKGNNLSGVLPGGGALTTYIGQIGNEKVEFLVTGNDKINFINTYNNSFSVATTQDDHQMWINVIKFFTDAQNRDWFVTGGYDGRAIIYQVTASGGAVNITKFAMCNGHASPIVDLKILEKQNLIATLSNDVSPNFDGSLRIWDLNGNQLAKLVNAQFGTIIRELNIEQTGFAIGCPYHVNLVQMQVDNEQKPKEEKKQSTCDVQ